VVFGESLTTKPTKTLTCKDSFDLGREGWANSCLPGLSNLVPEYRPSTSHLHGDICIYVYIYGEILGSSGVNLTNTKNILGLCKKWEQEPTMTWGYGPWGFNGEVMEHNGAVYDELFFMSQHQKSDKTAMKR
jgi:hypothetical protein